MSPTLQHSATTTCWSDCCIHSVWQSIPAYIKFPEVANTHATQNHDSTDHACSRFRVGFFEVANYNLNNGSNATLFDYYSSDNIFDNFDATFGSVEDAYWS